jgi:HAD superfamily hydrolase (TIGR01509 family)
MRRFRAVLLDIDGTLVDSNDAHALAWHDALAEHHVDIAPARLRRLIGMGGKFLLATVAPGIDGVDTRHGEIFRERYLGRVHAFPKTRELVLQLRREGYALAVATSGKPDDVQTLLEIAGVADLIERRATAGDVADPKPAPDVVEAALARVPVERVHAVLIGDAPYDVRAAARAGVAAIGMACGGFPAAELAGAVEVFVDPADLLARWASSSLADRTPSPC